MTITFVAAGTEGTGTAGTTVTAGLPAGIQANDILIAAGAANTVTGLGTMPAEWTRVTSLNPTNGPGFCVWWHRYDGSTTPSGVATFAGSSGSQKELGISAFRGCRTSGDPFNVKNGTTAANGTTSTASNTSVTTTLANCMLVAHAATDASLAYTAIPSGFTTAFEDSTAGTDNNYRGGSGASGAAVAQAYAIQAAAGASGAKTFTVGTTGNGWAAWMGALEPAGSVLTDPAPSDSVTVSDATPTMAYSQAVSDSVTATDSGIVSDFAQALADSITPTEAETAACTMGTVADSVTLTDNGIVAGTTLTDPAPSDSVTASDAAPVMAYAQALSDSVTATDNGPASAFTMGTVADSVTATDNGPTSAFGMATVADNVTATDSGAVKAPQPALADSVTASDAAPTMGFAQALADSVTPGDAEAAAFGMATVADSVTVTDSFSTNAGNSLSATPSDSVTVTDAAVMSVAPALSDGVAASDALASAVAHPVADTATVSDALAFGYPRSFADSVSVGDSVNLSQNIQQLYNRSFADTVTVPDSTLRKHTSEGSRATYWMRRIIAAPPILLRPNIRALFSIGRGKLLTLADSFGVGDMLSTYQPAYALADNVSVADALAKSYGLQFADGVTAADAAPNLNLFPPKPADTVTMLDSVVFHVKPVLADSVTPTDNGITDSVSKALADSVTMLDTSSTQSASHIGTSSAEADGSNNVTFSFGSAVAGDLAIIRAVYNAPAAPAGWTALSTFSWSYGYTEKIYYKTLSSGDISTGSVVLAMGVAGGAGSISIYRGATGVSVVDGVSGSSVEGGPSSLACSGITKSGSCKLVVSLLTNRDQTAPTAPTGFTSRLSVAASSGHFFGLGVADIIPGSYTNGATPTWNWTSSFGYNAVAWLIQLT